MAEPTSDEMQRLRGQMSALLQILPEIIDGLTPEGLQVVKARLVYIEEVIGESSDLSTTATVETVRSIRNHLYKG